MMDPRVTGGRPPPWPMPSMGGPMPLGHPVPMRTAYGDAAGFPPSSQGMLGQGDNFGIFRGPGMMRPGDDFGFQRGSHAPNGGLIGAMAPPMRSEGVMPPSQAAHAPEAAIPPHVARGFGSMP